jgi:hypothetical protein
LLLEINENLCRAELTPAQAADHLAPRKAIHLARHPETAQEAFHGNQHTGSLAANKLSVASFWGERVPRWTDNSISGAS